MPALHETGGYKIVMYFEDHNPPYVHVVGADFEGLVRLEDLAVFVGTIPSKFSKQALKWIEMNRVQLLAKWNDWH